MDYKNITGRRHGLLVAVQMVGKNHIGRALWLCNCDCGNTVVVSAQGLAGKNGTRSCGCLGLKAARSRPVRTSTNIKHGESGGNKCGRSSEYGSWLSMRQRCKDKNHSTFLRYGGVGITVCDRWDLSFEAFLQDMGRKPSRNFSIDRIDPNGNYCPENCRWADPTQQANNKKRKSTLVLLHGKEKLISDAAMETGIPIRTIYNWLYSLSGDRDISSFVDSRLSI